MLLRGLCLFLQKMQVYSDLLTDFGTLRQEIKKGGKATPVPNMKKYQLNAKIKKLTNYPALVKSLEGCNLILSLYGDENDRRALLIHAVTVEAREIVFQLLRATMQVHALILAGKVEEPDAVFKEAAQLQKRLQALRTCCSSLLRNKNAGKEVGA